MDLSCATLLRNLQVLKPRQSVGVARVLTRLGSLRPCRRSRLRLREQRRLLEILTAAQAGQAPSTAGMDQVGETVRLDHRAGEQPAPARSRVSKERSRIARSRCDLLPGRQRHRASHFSGARSSRGRIRAPRSEAGAHHDGCFAKPRCNSRCHLAVRRAGLGSACEEQSSRQPGVVGGRALGMGGNPRGANCRLQRARGANRSRFGGPACAARPENAEWVGSERKLGSEFLKEMLFRETTELVIPAEGVRIVGGWFPEPVDLAHGRLDHQLW